MRKSHGLGRWDEETMVSPDMAVMASQDGQGVNGTTFSTRKRCLVAYTMIHSTFPSRAAVTGRGLRQHTWVHFDIRVSALRKWVIFLSLMHKEVREGERIFMKN